MASIAGLESFLAVARTGNLTAAARELHVTQPGLTARLQRLEAELGAELLVRLPRGVRLTAAGRTLVPYAERALQSLDQGTAAVRDLVRGTGGRIEIGAAPAVSTYVLPRALQRFASEHPAVALGVRTGHSEGLLSLVLAEQVQIAIVRALRHPEIESTPLYEDEVVLATHPLHPFAGDHAVRVEQLGDQELILFDPSSSYHELTSAMFRAAGVAPRGVMVLDSIDAAKRMLQLGLGIALLPRSALRDELEDGSLAAVTVVSTAPVRRQIVAIRRRDAGELGPALEALVRCVQDVAAVQGPSQ
jgi:DNA-binding transcriptional LysR family regulator